MPIRPADHGVIASSGGAGQIIATGGTTSEAGGYKYHTFNASSSFVVSNPGADGAIEWVAVAGGGGGGGAAYAVNSSCGGGGAGGYQEGTFTVTATSYTVTIGAGGAGGAGSGDGGQGGDTDVSTILGGTASAGGGFADGYYGGDSASGGSGGGGGDLQYTWFDGGAGTAGQGYAGGDAVDRSAGGGGGQSEVGGNGSSATNYPAGPGGDGRDWQSLGTSYAGGAGGGSYGDYAAAGGAGGGGNGGSGGGGINPTSGGSNTGGGGGGGADNGAGRASRFGASGGSGIVVNSLSVLGDQMAHFAELDDNNMVIRVIVVADADTANEHGHEVEEIGAGFCVDLLGGAWKQTSYNNNMRRRYAGIGFTYAADRDAFIPPRPFPSWSLDDNHDWQPPAPHPDDGNPYRWDEDTGKWQPVTDD